MHAWHPALAPVQGRHIVDVGKVQWMRGGGDGAGRGAATAQQAKLENAWRDKAIHVHQAHSVVGVAVNDEVRAQ